MSKDIHIKDVAVLAPHYDGQTGPAIVKAFRDLGKSVDPYDPTKSTPGSIAEYLSNHEYDLIFCTREPSLVDHIKDIRENSNADVVTWNVDVRNDISFWESLFPLFKHSSVHYTVGFGNVDDYRALGFNTFWLPQGMQPENYHKIGNVKEDLNSKYGCDVCFIGGNQDIHEGRTEALDAIEKSNYDHKFWGCRGEPQVWDEEHNKAVFSSKINLSHSGWPNVERYMSVRTYKILAAGGFCLANYHKGMEDWLPIEGEDKILDFYTNTDELLKKIKYYLDNPEERNEIAANGYEWVQNNTYKDRMESVLNHLESRVDNWPRMAFYHSFRSVIDVDIKEFDDGKLPYSESELQSFKRRNNIDEDRTDEGECVVATIATPEIEDGLERLINDLRTNGNWDGRIDVFTNPNKSNSMKNLDCISNDDNINVKVSSWWYKNLQNAHLTSTYNTYIKPEIIDEYDKGDKVLYMDGRDVRIFKPINHIFERLENEGLLLSAPSGNGLEIPEPYQNLFNPDKDDYTRRNAGVMGFKVDDNSIFFFQLFKSMCMWSLNVGKSDQTAITLTTPIFKGFIGDLNPTENWCPRRGNFKVENGEVLTESGEPITILHNAGNGFGQEMEKLKETIKS